MHTPRINYTPPLVAHLIAQRQFPAKQLSLLDVGASGGIDSYWNCFGDKLSAIGFDPLVKEVERLNAASPSPNVRYQAFCVGYRGYDALLPPAVRSDKRQSKDNQPFGRSSAQRAQSLKERDYIRTYFDQTGDGTTATELIELDDLKVPDVDFIKIDTDGSDYQVLLGAEKTLAQGPVLGIGIECQFHGAVHAHSNTFCNLDRFLRSKGFSLFDIEVHRYSRSVLPRQFVYNIPAQTVAGQVLWGDALYLRDAGDADYETMWGIEFSDEKLITLACLFDLFGLGDCAAELLLKYRQRLAAHLKVDQCLDLLVPSGKGRRLSFQEHNELFDRKTSAFFP